MCHGVYVLAGNEYVRSDGTRCAHAQTRTRATKLLLLALSEMRIKAGDFLLPFCSVIWIDRKEMRISSKSVGIFIQLFLSLSFYSVFIFLC